MSEALLEAVRDELRTRTVDDPVESIELRTRSGRRVLIEASIAPRPIAPRPSLWAFSPDYRSADGPAGHFTFSPMQALAIRALVQASWSGAGEMSERAIMASAGSSQGRLDDLFRKGGSGNRGRHPAWGILIVKAGRALYRLAD